MTGSLGKAQSGKRLVGVRLIPHTKPPQWRLAWAEAGPEDSLSTEEEPPSSVRRVSKCPLGRIRNRLRQAGPRR